MQALAYLLTEEPYRPFEERIGNQTVQSFTSSEEMIPKAGIKLCKKYIISLMIVWPCYYVVEILAWMDHGPFTMTESGLA